MPFYALSEQSTLDNAPDWPYPVSWTQPPVDIQPERYLLKLTSLTGDAFSLSLKDLELLPQKILNRRWVSHNGWTVRCQWQGVLLQHLIEKLRPPTGQPLYIQQTNALGFQEAIPIKEMLLHRPMLIKGVNGQPLTPLHGGPLSVMTFNTFGYKGLAQITELSLTETPVNTWSKHLGMSESGTLQPGSYFAWDLGNMQPIKRATEIDEY